MKVSDSVIKFYGHPRCSTCKKAQQTLDASGIRYQHIDITTRPPSKSLIRAILKDNDLPIAKLFNHSGQMYRQLDMKQKIKTLDQDELIDLLANNGMLVKRPIVTDGDRHTVGFNAKAFPETWR